MDDIDRDIITGQIGQHREEAKEIIVNPPKPKTNLPPMKARLAPKKQVRSNFEDFLIVVELSIVVLLLIGVFFGTKFLGLW